MSLSNLDLFSEMVDRISRLSRERGMKITADQISDVISLLHRKQFLFRDDNPKQVEIINCVSGEIAKYFTLLRMDLVSDAGAGMVGLVPIGGVSRQNLTVDESAILLTLRLIYERRGAEGEGDRITTSFREIIDVAESNMKRTLSRLQVLDEAMTRFSACNVARIVPGNVISRNDTMVEILRSIRFVTSKQFTNQIEAFSQESIGASLRKMQETADAEDADDLEASEEEVSEADDAFNTDNNEETQEELI